MNRATIYRKATDLLGKTNMPSDEKATSKKLIEQNYGVGAGAEDGDLAKKAQVVTFDVAMKAWNQLSEEQRDRLFGKFYPDDDWRNLLASDIAKRVSDRWAEVQQLLQGF